jgi:hypothetical protein
LTLESAVLVPLGLAMADQQQRSNHRSCS